MKRIHVRVADTKRDGVLFKWTDHAGEARQETYQGRKTWNKINEAKLALEDRINRRGSQVNWKDFKQRCERSYISELELRSQEKPRTMLKRFDAMLAKRSMKPEKFECADLATEMVLQVKEMMQKDGLALASVRSNMATLWAIINWGIDAEMLPPIRRPRERKRKQDRTARSQKARGRSLTMEEIERMIDAIKRNPEFKDGAGKKKHVRRDDECPDRVIRAIHAMRLIGLRLEDCHLFRWNPTEGFHYPINLEGRMPRIVICGAQKSGDEEEIPLTNNAVNWLRSLEQDSEFICRARGARGDHQTHNRLGRIIGNAGRSTGIVTKRTGGKGGGPKFASAHDLRRTFVNDVLPDLTIAEAQILTRHRDKNTLLTYYADAKVPALAAKLQGLPTKTGGDLVDGEQARSRREG